jgi:Integrase core domain
VGGTPNDQGDMKGVPSALALAASAVRGFFGTPTACQAPTGTRAIASFTPWRIITLPPRSPNLNAPAERLVKTINESCLERMILFGEGSLREAVHEFLDHYHHQRNYPGLGNRLIGAKGSCVHSGAVERRRQLGGMLIYYYREAA